MLTVLYLICVKHGSYFQWANNWIQNLLDSLGTNVNCSVMTGALIIQIAIIADQPIMGQEPKGIEDIVWNMSC